MRPINLHGIAALVCPRCCICGKNTFGCISEEKLVQQRMKPGSEGPEEGQEDAVIWLSVSLHLGQHCGPSSITLQLLA